MMWQAAAERIRTLGGRVRLDCGVEHIAWDAARGLWTVSVRRGDGSCESHTARNVISSAPIRDLVAAISPTPISLLHARALAYRDFLTVALVCRRAARDLPDNWIYIHDPSVQVGRIQNFRSWSPEMIPGEDYDCFGLEYFCFEDDGLWASSDAELAALAKREIAKIGLVAEADVVDGCVVRQPKAYPVYDEEYRDHVAMIRLDLERSFPSLHLVGRNGMHKYNNQDHAMMTAMLTARNILAGERIFDTWQVNEDAEYHEAGAAGAKEALASERLVPRKTRAA
jgi:protoporphyrinogen oxidase